MSECMSNFHFRLMGLTLRLRDLFAPPKRKLQEAGIKPGAVILDYGCGIGSYSLAAAELVGDGGKVYAADIHPLAVQAVERLVARKCLRNIQTIRTDCATSLGNETIDTVLLYDTLHDLASPEPVLKELHRVLRPGGVLSASDHHLNPEEIVAKVAATGLSRLSERGKRTHKFAPTQRQAVPAPSNVAESHRKT